MRDVHTALAAWMARMGMTVRVDAIGNIRGVYPSAISPTTPSEVPRLYIGSHLDTVPNAGAFDGVLGVVLAIALVELAGRSDFHLPSRSSAFPTKRASGSARHFSEATRWPARSTTGCSIAPTSRAKRFGTPSGISAWSQTGFLTCVRRAMCLAISSFTSSRGPSSRT